MQSLAHLKFHATNVEAEIETGTPLVRIVIMINNTNLSEFDKGELIAFAQRRFHFPTERNIQPILAAIKKDDAKIDLTRLSEIMKKLGIPRGENWTLYLHAVKAHLHKNPTAFER
jgi:hypothetical protein